MGSVVAGSADFVERAARLRKRLGGGMRQVGVLAAPGIVALENMRDRLAEDHDTAGELARIFSGYTRIFLETPEPEINMVFCRILAEAADGASDSEAGPEGDRAAARFVKLLSERNIVTYPPFDGVIRFVTHYGIGEDELTRIEKVMPEVMEKLG